MEKPYDTNTLSFRLCQSFLFCCYLEAVQCNHPRSGSVFSRRVMRVWVPPPGGRFYLPGFVYRWSPIPNSRDLILSATYVFGSSMEMSSSITQTFPQCFSPRKKIFWSFMASRPSTMYCHRSIIRCMRSFHHLGPFMMSNRWKWMG